MRWRKVGRSQNVEDRRGGRGGAGLGRGMKVGGGGALILVILGLFLGQDLTGLIGGQGAGPGNLAGS